jgi:hypothetical protein
VAGIAASNAGKFECFRGISWVVISPPSLRLDLDDGYMIEGSRLVNNLGPVLCLGVGGVERSRSAKGGRRVRDRRERETAGERREKGFPQMETLHLEKTLNRNFPKTVTRLPLIIIVPYEL